MANDPNRDLLPVREDGCRSGKGFIDKIDYQILGKLSRCELEDKFLRLLDEQTHIKKLANSQEEKIKRLGTKLLRLINEKKNGKKISEHSKETEELNLRIIELEHENYTLKDKNTVLKQQLSSHTRHFSMNRSNHTSPLMTMRHCAPPTQPEGAYDATNKNEANDIQLQEAEAHIRELNDEIKSLHLKIDFLQQNLEKNNLDNSKIKVTENIELIRLQRSLKQQAIQIAALQEQVKSSEKTQKILKEDLIKAHKENDEALHLISEKQNEILCLCSKLEEKNLNRLEEDELKERINDLMIERDCLKERSDFLMKSIGAKAEESEKISELQRLLAEEKSKKEKLEEALEIFKSNFRGCTTEIVEASHCEKIKTAYRAQQTTPEEKEMINFSCNTFEDSESLRSQESSLIREIESDTEPSEVHKIAIKKKSCKDGKHVMEKMKLELELQYLREMLRSQTLRCEAQQTEISRLMYELKLNENKCSDTLRKLDWHLRVFEGLEMRSHQNEVLPPKNPEPVQEKIIAVPRQEPSKSFLSPRKPPSKLSPSREGSKKFQTSEKENTSLKVRNSSQENLPSKLAPSHTLIPPETENKLPAEPEQKRRFVEQTFLESSDEEINVENYQNRNRGKTTKPTHRMREPASLTKTSSENSVPTKPYEKDHRRDNFRRVDDTFDEPQTITIMILWFKVKMDSSLWRNENIDMLFIDFTFLDVNGEETETPQSLPKPRNPDKKCEFNFTTSIEVQGSRLRMFQKLTKNPDSGLFIFKVVSDSDKYDRTDEECQDIGVAVMTTKEFFEFCNKGPFHIKVRNSESNKEVIGTLGLSVEATPKLLKITN